MRGIVGSPPHEALIMSLATPTPPLASRATLPRVPGLWFASGFAGIAILARSRRAIPIEFSIATVFSLRRATTGLKPATRSAGCRRGPGCGGFFTSAIGIVGLTAAFAWIPWLTADVTDAGILGARMPRGARRFSSGSRHLSDAFADQSALRRRLGRSRVCSRRRVAEPAARSTLHWFTFTRSFALWLLDRELTLATGVAEDGRRGRVRAALLGVLWWHLHDAPDLPGSDNISDALSRDRESLRGVVLRGRLDTLPRRAHAFLEMVHYGV